MTTIVDKYGRIIKVEGDTYTFGGVTLNFGPGIDRAAALTTIEGMAPEGWAPPPEPVTPETITAAIDAMLDARAQSLGYDSTLSIATYVTSSVPEFKGEATSFIAWRDAVWMKAASDLAAVQAGSMAPPVSVAAYIATLPAL